jgi:predicted phage baseplate assembly protein
MAFVAPKLDDRQFQDLVDEAKKRIPHYCQEWTDHNVSDPGVTLIELFAWMTDVLLYRLNQVPDLHYIKFLEMLGIKLREPAPARTPVTFWLSAPQAVEVVIPAQTEVASTQTETESSIIFSTDKDLKITTPKLKTVLSRVEGKGDQKTYREYNLNRLSAGFEGLEIFSSSPRVNDALYFGFENDLGNHILGFELDFDPAGGAGIDPTQVPYLWEASTGLEDPHWHPCDVEIDNTKGLNTAGRIRIHTPHMGPYSIKKQSLYWVRVRIKEISESEYRDGMRPYEKSPRLRKVMVSSWGGTVPATHSRLIQRAFLGQSDGTPGQRFRLQNTPILKRLPGETLTVQVEGEKPQHWVEVSDFADSGVHDLHYTLDSVSGEIRFGPAVRQPDGTIKLYGAIPARHANLIFDRYRYGGGQEGNVQAEILNTLKTSIPFVAKVTNREPAWGGLNAESLEAAMMRAPALLRSRDRAVTEGDYELLAQQALPAVIGRVKCLQPIPEQAGKIAPGLVYVLVIPRVANPAGFIDPEELQFAQEDVEKLYAYLGERRLLTTRLEIRPPAYHWVSIEVKLRADPGAEQSQVEAEALARLYRFLNPLTGGRAGRGWEFGRDLFASEVYQALQGLNGVQFIRGVDMFNAQRGGEAQGQPIEQLEVTAHGVIASGIHKITFV